MSIAVICPGCKARLSAPDGAAGQRMKCPRRACGAAIEVPVPGAPVSFDEEPAPQPRRPAREPDELPDPDHDDDRPARRPRKTGASTGLILGIVFGSLGLLAAAGYGVFALTERKQLKEVRGPATAVDRMPPMKTRGPVRWTLHREDRDGFKALFPGLVARNEFGDRENEYSAFDLGEKLRAVLTVVTFAPGATAKERRNEADNRLDVLRFNGRLIWEKEVRYLGHDAIDLRVELPEEPDGRGNIVRPVLAARVFFTDERLYVLTIDSTDGESLEPDARTFFDGFELLP